MEDPKTNGNNEDDQQNNGRRPNSIQISQKAIADFNITWNEITRIYKARYPADPLAKNIKDIVVDFRVFQHLTLENPNSGRGYAWWTFRSHFMAIARFLGLPAETTWRMVVDNPDAVESDFIDRSIYTVDPSDDAAEAPPPENEGDSIVRPAEPVGDLPKPLQSDEFAGIEPPDLSAQSDEYAENDFVNLELSFPLNVIFGFFNVPLFAVTTTGALVWLVGGAFWKFAFAMSIAVWLTILGVRMAEWLRIYWLDGRTEAELRLAEIVRLRNAIPSNTKGPWRDAFDGVTSYEALWLPGIRRWLLAFIGWTIPIVTSALLFYATEIGTWNFTQETFLAIVAGIVVSTVLCWVFWVPTIGFYWLSRAWASRFPIRKRQLTVLGTLFSCLVFFGWYLAAVLFLTVEQAMHGPDSAIDTNGGIGPAIMTILDSPLRLLSGSGHPKDVPVVIILFWGLLPYIAFVVSLVSSWFFASVIRLAVQCNYRLVLDPLSAVPVAPDNPEKSLWVFVRDSMNENKLLVLFAWYVGAKGIQFIRRIGKQRQ